MYPQTENIFIKDTFKREKLFHLLHYLKIDRASLQIEDEILEYTTLRNRTCQLFPSGGQPQTFVMEHRAGHCPVCGEAILVLDRDEDTLGHITLDYRCPECNFRGTEWYYKAFIGHTSSVHNHTIESYRTQINN